MSGSPLEVEIIVAQVLVFVVSVFYASRRSRTLVMLSFLLPALLLSWPSFVFVSAMTSALLSAKILFVAKTALLLIIALCVPCGIAYAVLRHT